MSPFKRLALGPLVLLAALAAVPAIAQPWEEVFGAKDQEDEGHRRVTPVQYCPDGGYIAVGTRDWGGQRQVYVVRTKNSGGVIFENAYDVRSDGRDDEGFALAELRDGSGYAITGTSRTIRDSWAIHLLKIACDGEPLFSYIYQLPVLRPSRSVGHDIREAASGNGVNTHAGDLLIAGYTEDANLQADAVLLRLTAAGNLIWGRKYNTGSDERFFGLTETTPAAPLLTGDIAAVGELRRATDSQALVARVNGDNGLINLLTDQCMAAYGDVGDENFQSIVETQTAPDTGLLTMAGMSTSPGAFEDIYVVQTKPNPCGLRVQRTMGNDTGDPRHDYATDLIEVLAPTGLSDVPVGSFALTGLVETKFSQADAFLLFIQQGTLIPIAARRYGDHADGVEFGTSLAQNPPLGGPQPLGFIIAGTTFTDWDHSGDPMDLYLVQPDDTAATGCELEWQPAHDRWSWAPEELPFELPLAFSEREVDTIYERISTVVRVCH